MQRDDGRRVLPLLQRPLGGRLPGTQVPVLRHGLPQQLHEAAFGATVFQSAFET